MSTLTDRSPQPGIDIVPAEQDDAAHLPVVLPWPGVVDIAPIAAHVAVGEVARAARAAWTGDGAPLYGPAACMLVEAAAALARDESVPAEVRAQAITDGRGLVDRLADDEVRRVAARREARRWFLRGLGTLTGLVLLVPLLEAFRAVATSRPSDSRDLTLPS